MRTLNDEELSVVHKKVLYLLKVFSEICERHNIWYSLAYGTMLGAVREKGFIPWDTDADVVIRLEDKEKVREAFMIDKPDGIMIKEHDNTEKCLQSHDTVCYVEKQFVDGIHVDVLPLVGAPSDKREQKKFVKHTFYIDKIIRSKYVNVSDCKPKNKPLVVGAKIIDFFIPDNVLRNNIYKREHKYPVNESEYVTTLANSGNSRCCIPKEIFDEMIQCMFCDIPFFIPKNWDRYLRQMYGDNYMTPIKW